MPSAIPYTISRESITIIYEGTTHTIKATEPKFAKVRAACLASDWAALPHMLSPALTIKNWARGRFSVRSNWIYFDDEKLPSGINKRIIELARRGNDPSHFLRFWQRLQKNPSYRSVQQLFKFLDHGGIPIVEDGCFLAYKGVRANYLDCHSGKFDNHPGKTLSMPRNKISDDPQKACHEGFHVGAKEHAQGYGQRMVVCKIDPEHVVCVPYDANNQKMRVCEYTVIADYKRSDPLLPSTIAYLEDILPPVREEGTLSIPVAEGGELSKPAPSKVGAVSTPTTAPRPTPAPVAQQAPNQDREAWLLEQPLDKFLRPHAKSIGVTRIKEPGGKPRLVEKILAREKEVADGKKALGDDFDIPAQVTAEEEVTEEVEPTAPTTGAPEPANMEDFKPDPVGREDHLLGLALDKVLRPYAKRLGVKKIKEPGGKYVLVAKILVAERESPEKLELLGYVSTGRKSIQELGYAAVIPVVMTKAPPAVPGVGTREEMHEAAPVADSLENNTLRELRQLAKSLGIKGFSKVPGGKAGLIPLIRKAQAG